MDFTQHMALLVAGATQPQSPADRIRTLEWEVHNYQKEVTHLRDVLEKVRIELENEGYHYPNEILCRIYDALGVGPDYER